MKPFRPGKEMEMKNPIRLSTLLIAALALCAPLQAADELLESLLPDRIAVARINLNPRGAQTGFEAEFRGDDPRLAPLASVLREATPGKGHKCPNAGMIRFRMVDGAVVGIGLLPGHEAGLYEIRLYDGEDFTGVWRVDREALLTALGGLGLPMDDPAFRE
jgi:hypothetical protein